MPANNFDSRKDTKLIDIPKLNFLKNKGEHKNKLVQFASQVHLLKDKVQHHM